MTDAGKGIAELRQTALSLARRGTLNGSNVTVHRAAANEVDFRNPRGPRFGVQRFVRWVCYGSATLHTILIYRKKSQIGNQYSPFRNQSAATSHIRRLNRTRPSRRTKGTANGQRGKSMSS